jgi:hypothetical protein
MHAKITGINTNFVKPKAGKKIYAVDAIPVAEVLPELATVELAGATVDTETEALTIGYIGTPLTTPNLAYQWKIASSPKGQYENISNATSGTYTPTAGDVGKYIKCEVTASGSAVGVKLSNAKRVAPMSVEVSSSIEDADPTKINVVLDEEVTGLVKDNFALIKGDEAYTDFIVTETDSTQYVLTMSDAAAESDVFTLTIEKTGYAFTGTSVTNNVTD